MHDVEPFYAWRKYYDPYRDRFLPFFGHKPDYSRYTHDIYGYYIHPEWDFIGSETLYVKVLFVDYVGGLAIIELLGEWNDTLHNDVMFLKRRLADPLIDQGVNKFVLIGENVLNFHGSDDCYYEEWAQDIEDEGWICALNFRPFVQLEQARYNLLQWINHLELIAWRTRKPQALMSEIESQIPRLLT